MLINSAVRYQAREYESMHDAFYQAYTLMKNCIYDDNFEDIIEFMINNSFSNVIDQIEIKKRILTSVNTLRKWVDSVSRVYDRGCSRTFRTGTGIDEVASEVYSKIKNFDQLAIEINKKLNLHNTIVIYVRYDDKLKMFFLEIFDRESCTVEYSYSIQDITKFSFQRIHENDEFVDVTWDIENHKAKKKGGESVLEGNPNEVNPYGIIPAIPIRKFLTSDFWCSTRGHGLVSSTLSTAFQNTVQEFARYYQSFKMAVVSGGKIGAQTQVGPNKWVEVSVEKVDQIPSVSVLDFQANFSAMQDVIEKMTRLTIDSYGMSDVAIQNPDNSGVAIQMRNEGTKRIIESTMPILAGFEANLFNVIRTIWNIHNPGRKIKDDTVISVSFGFSASYLNANDLSFDLQKVKNGLMSIKDFYLKYNPGADQDTALETLRNNIQEYRDIFGGSGIGGGFQPAGLQQWV